MILPLLPKELKLDGEGQKTNIVIMRADKSERVPKRIMQESETDYSE